VTMGLVRHALDELPEAHQALWLRARLIVKLAASQHYMANRSMNDVLAVIADADTLIADVVARFFGVQVVQQATDDEPLVAVLQGEASWRLLTNFPDAASYDIGLAGSADFRVLTSPAGSRPGLSICRVIERSRFH
jgi:hypothetical protein